MTRTSQKTLLRAVSGDSSTHFIANGCLNAPKEVSLPDLSRARDMRLLWLTTITYWIVASILCCSFYPVMMSDTMARYAPMADRFASGDWFYSFHPRFGLIFQVLTGTVVYLTGLTGDKATQVVSVLFVALTAVPLWCIVEKIFDRKTAWWSVALLLVVDDYTRYAMDGLRDPGKCLAYALMGYSVVFRKSSAAALGIIILSTLVTYGFAVSSLFLFCWFIYFAWKREWSKLLLPSLAWVLSTAAITVMVHAYTGWWTPVPHFIPFLEKWL